MNKLGTLILAGIVAFSIQAQAQWNKMPMPTNKPVNFIETLPDGTLLCSNADGLFRMNQSLWENVLGTEVGSVRDMLVLPSETESNTKTILLATLNGGVLKSTDNGASWVKSNKGIGTFSIVKLYRTNQGILLAGTNYGGLYRSDNNGESWTLAGLEGECVTSFLTTNSGKLLIGTYKGIYTSATLRAPWKEITNGLTNRVVESMIKTHNGTIFVGTYNIGPCAPGGIFVSTDNAESFTKIALEGVHIKQLLALPTGELLAATWCEGVVRSVDEGNTWTPLNDGSTEPCAQAISLAPNGTLYAAYYGAPTTSTMYTYQSEQSAIAGDIQAQPILGEIHPNPASSTAYIPYTIYTKGIVSIKILNAIGEEIETLHKGVQTPGTYSTTWNIGLQEAGVYSVVVSSGKSTETARIVVVK